MGINAKEYHDTYHGGKDYVDADVMKEDWNNFTQGNAKQDLLDLFFDQSRDTIDCLISHGFAYGEGSEDGEGFGFGGLNVDLLIKMFTTLNSNTLVKVMVSEKKPVTCFMT